MRVALAQTDCVLGDLETNLETARVAVKTAPATDPRVLALSGLGPDVVVGLYEDGDLRRYNSALYLSGGQVTHVHRKQFLPTYLTWEERKHLTPGQAMRAFDTGHGRMAALVFVNRVGEENGATFWGGSRVIDPVGSVVAQAPMGEPAVVVTDVDLGMARWVRRTLPLVTEARLGLVLREVDRLAEEGGDF